MAKKTPIYMSVTASAVIAAAFVGAQDADAATHQVQKGDTLWAISQQYGTTVSELKNLNRLTSDLIHPNQTLEVGDNGSASNNSQTNIQTQNKPAKTQPTQTTRTSQTGSKQSTSNYTVVKGDTLSQIAFRHNISLQNLLDWNGLTTTLIYPGDKLVVSKNSSNSATNNTTNSSQSSTSSNKSSASNTTPSQSSSQSSNQSKTNSSSSTYVVKKGDTLSAIAAKAGISLNTLMSNNNISSHLIYPGDRLVISNNSSNSSSSNNSNKNNNTSGSSTNNNSNSSADKSNSSSSTNSSSNSSSSSSNSSSNNNSNSNSSSNSSSSGTHTVVPGDTLSGIAHQYGTTVDQIKSLNNITSHIIYPGNKIKLPSSATQNSSTSNSTTTNNSSNSSTNNSSTNSNTSSNSSSKPSSPSVNSGSLIDTAKSMIGTRYTWAGTQPSTGFDCSGFMYWALNESGTNMPRLSTDGYYNRSYMVNSPQVGDLVFFENTYRQGISHAGFYVGNNQFIHAGSNGVEISSLNNSYWSKHFHSFKKFY